MKVYGAETTIKGTPESIWWVLTDASRYPEWDPDMIRIEGKIGQSEHLKMWTKLAPNRAFKVQVTELTPNKRMVWTGGMPLKFLFKGERTFELTPQGDSVKVSSQEKFTGLLSPLFGRMIPDLNPSFKKFVDGLKHRVETGAKVGAGAR